MDFNDIDNRYCDSLFIYRILQCEIPMVLDN